jgi:type IV secretory pathway TraG/TraD family ATPase VirD4
MRVTLGRLRQQWGWDAPFQVETEASDRTARHINIIASTGAGKSTLFRHLILAEIGAGNGLALEDPHGDLHDFLLTRIPKQFANKVIVFAPTYNAPSYVGINPVLGSDLDKRVTDVLALVGTLWENGWGPQSEFISLNIGRAISQVVKKPTLLHYDRAFLVRAFLERLADRATRPETRDFFQKMLGEWDKRQLESAAAPPTNKFNTFNQPVLRHVIGQANGLDFERIIAERQILLCRFSMDELGERIAKTLAHLVQSELMLAGYARRKVPPAERHHFNLFVDEAEKMAAANDFDKFLNEARKYNLSLVTGWQHVAQIKKESRSAVFNNVSANIAGTVGAEDAEILAAELGLAEPNSILRTNAHHWHAKLKRDGLTLGPYFFESLPTPRATGKEAKADAITARSDERYAMKTEVIEHEIERSMRAIEEAVSV